jgi:hypothetical protein
MSVAAAATSVYRSLMRMFVFTCVVGAALVWGALPVGAASPDPSQPAAGPQSAAPTRSPAGKLLTLEDYIKAAQTNGYEPSILGQPGDRILVLKLTKLGKTESGHGILQRKWDQKDTIDLTLGKQEGGLALEGVSRDVMVKPPIGDWIKQPVNDVPAWVLAPALTTG